MTSTSEYASDGTTLVEVVRELEADGFAGQFAPTEDGALRCLTCRAESPAGKVEVRLIRRTEGASDPADMVAVAALVCPKCGAKGTAALKYGPEATPEEAEALRHLDDAHRRSGGPEAG
jgi:hypothetical protein